MKVYIKKTIAAWIAVLLLCAGLITQTEAVQQPLSEKTDAAGVTVTSADELATALSGGETQITISGVITVGETADDTGKMLPLEIPGNVTIQGADENAILYCRCPLQITGDQVTIQNIQLKFVSGEALGSVAHREIFLAGHSLILDNVDTYQEGSGGSLGNLGGSEEELLPTVYAGGFEGSTVSGNAALMIRNANENTRFQAIYMSHDAGTDSKESYIGKAVLEIGPKTVVRDGIYVNQNSSAEVLVTGAEYANLSKVAFYGNENTTLQIEKVSVNRASLDQIGNVIVKDNGYLQLVSGSLNDITLQGGACLDAGEMSSLIVSGDFAGGAYDAQTDTRGVLVLAETGTLSVGGTATGTTIFHTENRYFPGEYTDAKAYISVSDNQVSSDAFVLPESMAEDYELIYEKGVWTVYSLFVYESLVVGNIEILSSPQRVDVTNIVGENFVPASQAPYCTVVWKDENGTAYTEEDVHAGQFYASDMVIGIRSDYWNSSDYDERTDWGVPVWFVTDEENPGKYYFYTESGCEITSGSYTYLFCTTYFDSLGNVADVKSQLDGMVKAQITVEFYDSTEEEEPSQTLVHTHVAGEKQIVPATPVVSLRGEYSGTMKATFVIRPKNTAITKITSSKKKFVVKWKKVSAQISGYQIQYSTSKKFTKKTTKSLLIKNKKTVKTTIKKPKSGKKYYVRIRTYKTVKVNGKSTKMYSAWSKSKVVK